MKGYWIWVLKDGRFCQVEQWKEAKGIPGRRKSIFMKVQVLEGGTMVDGVHYWQPTEEEWKRWLGRLIHGFVGQSENVALCSVSNRESSKVFIKAEE